MADHTSMLRERVLKQVDAAAASELSAAALRRQLEEVVHQIATDERLEISAREQARIAEEMVNDMVGFGPLEPLLRRRRDHRHHGQRAEPRVRRARAAS